MNARIAKPAGLEDTNAASKWRLSLPRRDDFVFSSGVLSVISTEKRSLHFQPRRHRGRFRYSESSVNLMNTQPEPSGDFVSLYRRAFAEYGPRALWNMRPIDDPTPSDALAITKALRTHGGMEGRRLAENIERLCRAAH